MAEQLSGSLNLNFVDTFKLDATFNFPLDRVTGIFGPSGSGKTTLLRCIAGLQKCRGRLTFNGTPWQQGGNIMPCHRRPIGYVFQEASLFPHLNVAGNLAYAQRRASGVAANVDEVIALLDLGPLLTRRPDRLSGGERQRVAIARALLNAPQLLLMDEPLSGLDDQRKAEILPYLESLCRGSRIPILYVSHSVDEVCRLADDLLVMDQGRVAGHGPLEQMLIEQAIASPGGHEVSAVLRARVSSIDSNWALAALHFSGGEIWVAHNGEGLGTSQRLRIRAQDVSLSLSAHRDTSIQNILPCTIREIRQEPSGTMQLLVLQLGDDHLLARLTRRSVDHLGLAVGMAAFAQIKSVAIVR